MFRHRLAKHVDVPYDAVCPTCRKYVIPHPIDRTKSSVVATIGEEYFHGTCSAHVPFPRRREYLFPQEVAVNESFDGSYVTVTRVKFIDPPTKEEENIGSFTLIKCIGVLAAALLFALKLTTTGRHENWEWSWW